LLVQDFSLIEINHGEYKEENENLLSQFFDFALTDVFIFLK